MIVLTETVDLFNRGVITCLILILMTKNKLKAAHRHYISLKILIFVVHIKISTPVKAGSNSTTTISSLFIPKHYQEKFNLHTDVGG